MSVKSIFLLLVLSSYSEEAHSQEPSPLKLQTPITTLTGHEGIIADVTIAAGAELPAHQHPGDEFLYMLRGSVELSRPDQETLTLRAGDAFQIAAGTVHTPRGGPEGARAIVFRVHPQGEQITVPVNE